MSEADAAVVLRLTGEQCEIVRQELQHAAAKIEAQARHPASPRGQRQRILLQRAAALRQITDQLTEN
jgi:hypothetical protein